MPKIRNRFTPVQQPSEPASSETIADMFKRKLGWKPITELRNPNTKT